MKQKDIIRNDSSTDVISSSELEDRILLQRMIEEKIGDYVSENEIINELKNDESK